MKHKPNKAERQAYIFAQVERRLVETTELVSVCSLFQYPLASIGKMNKLTELATKYNRYVGWADQFEENSGSDWGNDTKLFYVEVLELIADVAGIDVITSRANTTAAIPKEDVKQLNADILARLRSRPKD